MLRSTHDAPGGLLATTRGDAGPEPGLVLIFSAGQPGYIPVPVGEQGCVIGRAHERLAHVADPRMSRQHAHVSYARGAFQIRDLGSRNGCVLAGAPVSSAAAGTTGDVLRLGDTLFLLCEDLAPYLDLGVSLEGDRVLGPLLRLTMRAVASAAQVSRSLFITGESGAGKEALAQAYHQAGPQRGGPFVAVNCSTIAEGVAERLLETSAVLPLGGTRARPVQVRVCCATHMDLRRMVARGAFRADLFFRIGVPEVNVPPLRQRLEEIPWHVDGAVRRSGVVLPVHASLVEACLLRPWPGNVRELCAEVNTAVIAALAAGEQVLDGRHLRVAAGARLTAEVSQPAAEPAPEDPGGPLTRELILGALADARGNVSAAARALGIERTQLRRHLARFGLTRLRGPAGSRR